MHSRGRLRLQHPVDFFLELGAEVVHELSVDLITAPWIGDLDGMVERRRVRLLTPYSKTHYFIDKGVQRGTWYSGNR